MADTVVTELDVLREARNILSKRGAWTTKVMARDANNERTTPDSPSAVCFCAMGAVRRAAYTLAPRMVFTESEEFFYRVWTLLTARGKQEWARRHRSRFVLTDWNDMKSRRKEHVISLFDRVIAEQQEQVNAPTHQ